MQHHNQSCHVLGCYVVLCRGLMWKSLLQEHVLWNVMVCDINMELGKVFCCTAQGYPIHSEQVDNDEEDKEDAK